MRLTVTYLLCHNHRSHVVNSQSTALGSDSPIKMNIPKAALATYTYSAPQGNANALECSRRSIRSNARGSVRRGKSPEHALMSALALLSAESLPRDKSPWAVYGSEGDGGDPHALT